MVDNDVDTDSDKPLDIGLLRVYLSNGSLQNLSTYCSNTTKCTFDDFVQKIKFPNKLSPKRDDVFKHPDMFSIVNVDGACLDNGQPHANGGCGIFWGEDDPRNQSLSLPLCSSFPQTNNRAELYAAIVAVKGAIDSGIRYLMVRSDSTYVVNTMNSFLNDWKESGTLSNHPNNDLWLELDGLCQSVNVKWVHVKGHSGDSGNEAADKLAEHAASVVRDTTTTTSIADSDCVGDTLVKTAVPLNMEDHDSCVKSVDTGSTASASSSPSDVATCGPSVQTADIASPSVQTADVASPIPSVQTADVASPIPSVQTADIASPRVQTADVASPSVQTADIGSPSVQTADVASPIPSVQTADVVSPIPSVQTADAASPSVQAVQTADVASPIPNVQTADVASPCKQIGDGATCGKPAANPIVHCHTGSLSLSAIHELVDNSIKSAIRNLEESLVTQLVSCKTEMYNAHMKLMSDAVDTLKREKSVLQANNNELKKDNVKLKQSKLDQSSDTDKKCKKCEKRKRECERLQVKCDDLLSKTESVESSKTMSINKLNSTIAEQNRQLLQSDDVIEKQSEEIQAMEDKLRVSLSKIDRLDDEILSYKVHEQRQDNIPWVHVAADRSYSSQGGVKTDGVERGSPSPSVPSQVRARTDDVKRGSPSPDIIIIGNSHTRYIEPRKMYKNKICIVHTLDEGEKNVDGALRLVDRLESSSPTAVVLQVASNSLSELTADSCVEKVSSLVSKCAAKFTGAEICVAEALPRLLDSSSQTERQFNDNVVAFNGKLNTLGVKIIRHGALQKAVPSEFYRRKSIHLNGLGMAVFIKNYKTVLNPILGLPQYDTYQNAPPSNRSASADMSSKGLVFSRRDRGNHSDWARDTSPVSNHGGRGNHGNWGNDKNKGRKSDLFNAKSGDGGDSREQNLSIIADFLRWLPK